MTDINVVLVEVQNYCGRGREYVARMRAALTEHLQPRRVYIVTENTSELYPGSICMPSAIDLRGWWQKLRLFESGRFRDGALMLYLDLDIIVTGDLRELAGYRGTFAILRDFQKYPACNSSVMLWRAGAVSAIWDRWISAGRPTAAQDMPSDQHWITRAGVHCDWLQDLYPGFFCSYKRDVVPIGRPPPDTRAVVFHGRPRPHEVDWSIAA